MRRENPTATMVATIAEELALLWVFVLVDGWLPVTVAFCLCAMDFSQIVVESTLYGNFRSCFR
jgi:hypothetical protein